MGSGSREVEPLSAEQIERIAEGELRRVNPGLLKKPMLTPIVEIMKRAADEHDVSLVFDEDLGVGPDGGKIVGKFLIRSRSIMIDRSIRDTPRFPFAAAHEFGHFVLHRGLQLPKSEYPDLVDTERDLATGHKVLRTARDWIEWQANRFASALLMPRGPLKNALIAVQETLGIVSRQGTVFVEGNQSSMRDFAKVKMLLAKLYNVNGTNVEYRLAALKWLVDKRGGDLGHLSTFGLPE